MNVLGERLRKLRTNKGLSGDELSGLLMEKGKKMSKHAISAYETGKAEPDLETISLFCQIFNTTSDYLLGLTVVKKPDTTIQAISEYTGLSENAICLLNDSTIRSRTSFERPTYAEGISFLIENDKSKDKKSLIEDGWFDEDYPTKKVNSLLNKNNKIHVLSNILKFLFRETKEKDNRPIALTYYGDIIDTNANIRSVEVQSGCLSEEPRADESEFEEAVMASELVNNWRLDIIKDGLKELKQKIKK